MSMKYVDEYRDPELAKRIAADIDRLSAGRSLKLMEVCGGHT
ncbi:MAG: hydrogenase formation protein HypD, partial [Chloroflexi bacterium]|nr:hydrogenase formation protein HypD [Chloroflexota bacterium]